jgi:large subunit ribosomal protein L22
MAPKKPAKKTGRKPAPSAKSEGKTAAKKKAVARSAPKAESKTTATRGAAAPPPTRIAYQPREAKATQRTARQSPYKMRLVIDQIRGQGVNEALALLAFSKKHAAKQIEKVVRSAVANAEHAARNSNATLDVDDLFIKYAVINEGPKLKRWTPAAMGRATPVLKRTSHVEIVVAERPEGR